MSEENRKVISETLYLGLLFAQEDAGGELGSGSLVRWDDVETRTFRDFVNGLLPCNCIHGAAIMVADDDALDDEGVYRVGRLGNQLRAELNGAGVSVNAFDHWAAIAKSVTVDNCLRYFGVDVVPDEELSLVGGRPAAE